MNGNPLKNSTLRTVLVDAINRLGRKNNINEELSASACYTEQEGSAVAGILFDHLTLLDERVMLSTEDGTYMIPIDSLPTKYLVAYLNGLLRLENRRIETAKSKGDTNQEKLAKDMAEFVGIVEKTKPFESERSASGRQVFETLLALGGPWGKNDLLNDGSGLISLTGRGVKENDLPYILVFNAAPNNDKPEVHRIDEIDWAVELDQMIVATLHNNFYDEEFLFEIHPDGTVKARAKNANMEEKTDSVRIALPTGQIQRLEDILFLKKIKEDAMLEAEKSRSREIAPLGTFYFLALKKLLKKKGQDALSTKVVYFDASSYEYTADIPHVHTWWGGIAAIAEIELLGNQTEDNLMIKTYGICGMHSGKVYNGLEDEDWELIFSQAYTELQNAEDPEWEEWIEEFRQELEKTFADNRLNTAVLRAIAEDEANRNDGKLPGYIPAEDGVPIQSINRKARLLAVTVSDGSEIYQGIPAGKPAYGIDDNGNMFLTDGSDIALADIICAMKISY